MKVKISPETLTKIKDAVNIIDVIGEHVVLRKAGSNYSGLCPFHNERSPSFSVSEPKQLYHCYGCKKSGDLITFVMEIHGLSFVEAAEELAERANVKLPKSFGEEGDSPEVAKRRADQREKTQTAYKLNRFAAKFFREALPREKHIGDYFTKRGISELIAQNFYLGAAPAQWSALSEFFVKSKAPMDLAEELGLVKKSPKASGPGYFDLFRNRAMFPIIDLKGKVVGFGGRALPLPAGAPDVGGESPKYLNSSESLLFQKSKLLYGLFQAQKHIREKDEAIIVEGYFDVLALHGAGFSNAVATCGTSLTTDHLALLRKFCTKIIILFDGDRAGIAATDKAMELGLSQGMILQGASIPGGMDPDEFIAQGPEKMRALLDGASPLLDTRIEAAFRYSLKGPEQKTQALKQLGSWLGAYSDPIGREVRFEAAMKLFDIPRTLLEKAITQAKVTPKKDAPANRPAAPKSPEKPSRLGIKIGSGSPKRQKLPSREAVLVSGAIGGGEFFTEVRAAGARLPSGFTLTDLVSDNLRPVWTKILAGEIIDSAYLATIEDEPVRSLVSESILSGAGTNHSRAPLDPKDFRTALERCLAAVWARFSQELKQRLKDAELKKDAGLHADLMKEYLDVQRRMKEFANFHDEI